jgi:archaellum biogenesis ATPase FlaH
MNTFLNKEVKSGGNVISKIDFTNETFISSGIHVLDALTSANILEGGVSNNRFTCISGENSTGKTYLALNYCRNAIKNGYYVIYIDSEGNINDKLVKSFGIDTTKFRLENKLGTLEKFKTYMAKLLKQFETEVEKGNKLPKILFVIDSLANFPSEKEISDTESGADKQDMTKNKTLKSLFRIITVKLNLLEMPLIGISHGYFTMDMFPKFVVSGGSGISYNASTIILLSKAKLDEGDKDELDLQLKLKKID